MFRKFYVGQFISYDWPIIIIFLHIFWISIKWYNFVNVKLWKKLNFGIWANNFKAFIFPDLLGSSQWSSQWPIFREALAVKANATMAWETHTPRYSPSSALPIGYFASSIFHSFEGSMLIMAITIIGQEEAP